MAKGPAAGAVPITFCATSPEVATHGGAVWTEGPRVRLMAPLEPFFNDANRDAAFSAINKVLRTAGRGAIGPA